MLLSDQTSSRVYHSETETAAICLWGIIYVDNYTWACGRFIVATICSMTLYLICRQWRITFLSFWTKGPFSFDSEKREQRNGTEEREERHLLAWSQFVSCRFKKCILIGHSPSWWFSLRHVSFYIFYIKLIFREYFFCSILWIFVVLQLYLILPLLLGMSCFRSSFTGFYLPGGSLQYFAFLQKYMCGVCGFSGGAFVFTYSTVGFSLACHTFCRPFACSVVAVAECSCSQEFLMLQ